MKLNEEMQTKVDEHLGLIHKVIHDQVQGPYQMGIRQYVKRETLRSKILWRLFSFGGKHEVIT